MRRFLAFSALLALSASPFTADAQPAEGVRFRGGVGIEGGALVPLPTGQGSSSSFATVGAVALQGQLGVQITRAWAAYAAPSAGVVFGGGALPLAGAALLGEYTFDDVPISLGAGVETSVLVPVDAFYGGRLHAAWYPVVAHGEGGRRRALYIGLDVRFLAVSVIGGPSIGITGECFSPCLTASSSTPAFLLSPMASIGFVAF